MAKLMMKGNEAMALAALKGGCKAFFGYPITPQSELPEYLSRYMRDYGGVFLQAESEIAAINMVYGASAAGVRVMTSSSSPGIALKQEGISYMAGSELPGVIINVMRGGPGLGGIQPSQADYKQVTRGGGNGDYYCLAFAPESLQETVDIIKESFDLSDIYRNPVMIAVDGLIGQMMEPVDVDKEIKKRWIPENNWATNATMGQRQRRIVNSLYLNTPELEAHCIHLHHKYQKMKENEQRYEIVHGEDAEIIIVAYGTMARICRSAIEELREQGIKVGLLRPISIWPYPEKAFDNLSSTVKGLLVCELSMGQMLDDVKIANKGRLPISFFGRSGGMIPETEEIMNAVIKMREGLVNE
ncbi:MAG TPA: 3-methyl-2-oxobutanoate dehydrogenase subunit VorB [Bacilli bacterium]|jgi:2-oxoglutarate ferredoxin oxidoreductase subunit alpha|nr:3-methyl-2-oxobutanoate dehydrogenase subunit VorB [Sedimentibacter sp.]HOE15654.1 3-methyl-2-oxobutanoate dehydrogenase subunit VorB [Candidatus Paceibacterota bacterium]HPL55099.1 3-methyl-2-oxobutanoate dehydrogenase subunit VorB [Bacilli bacterium]